MKFHYFLDVVLHLLQSEVLEKELLLLFIRQMNHIKKVVLVFLNVFVKRAYHFARRTGCNCI